MFIDKFYRLYNPYERTTPRATREKLLTFDEKIWDAKNERIGRVKAGTDWDDVSTVGQTLTRKDDTFVQGKNKYEFIELKNNNWNAKKRKLSNLNSGENDDDAVTLSQVPRLENSAWNFKNKILSNIQPGQNDNDAANLGQVLRYDPVKNVFKCGNIEFDLVINTPSNPVLVADESTISGLRKYNGDEYRHKTHVYNHLGVLLSTDGDHFHWNQERQLVDQLIGSRLRKDIFVRIEPI